MTDPIGAPTKPTGQAREGAIFWQWAPTSLGEILYWQYSLAHDNRGDGNFGAFGEWASIQGAEAVYAFRKKVGANVVGLYASSAAGWQEVDLGKRLHFDAGEGTPPEVHTVITGATSGATARVQRVVANSGDYTEGDAAGFILISDVTGAFRNDENLTWTARDSNDDNLTVNGTIINQQIPWRPGVRLRLINHNFYAHSGGERMYGVTGAGPAFEFDGELFTPIFTGIDDDRPHFLAAHENHLFLGYPQGSLIHSALGDPVSFQDADGAAEIATGATMTGILSGYRETLFVYAANQLGRLFGTSAADWHFRVIDDEAGGIADTIQITNQPISYDDRGIRGLSATDEFGDFSVGTISDKIRPLLDAKRKAGVLPIASCRVRAKSQYRLWFDDGDCVVLSYIIGPRGRPYTAFGLMRYETVEFPSGQASTGLPIVTRRILEHVASVENRDGRERVYATFRGSGFVYELEKGINFDGEAIPAIMQLTFNDFGRASMIKRFRKLLLETDAEDLSQIQVSADFDDGKSAEERTGFEFEVLGRGTSWGAADWENFEKSTEAKDVAEARIAGRGRNIAPVIYSHGDDIPPHAITGMTALFIPVKTQR